MPCLRLINFYSRRKSSKQLSNVSGPASVSLAYSEYLVDNSNAIKDSPIFILHGLLGSKSNWNTVSKKIAASSNRKVIALDLRNHGDSPHTKEFDYIHMVADLKQLMIEQGVGQGKATILGHSLGGRIAMAFALGNPDKIRDLVIVDVSPLGMPPGANYVPRLLDALEAVTLKPGISLSLARKQAGEQMKKYIRGEKLRNFLLTNLIIDEKTNSFVWKINVQSVKENFPLLLMFPKFETVYNQPCLFIAGEKSEYLKKDDEGDIKKIFPKAEFKYISEAGHLVHYERPKVFLEIVCEFLNKNMSVK